jgi:hypothetical protein
MRRVIDVVAFLLPALACAGDDLHVRDPPQMGAVSPNDPPIQITINPEARISVTLAGPLPASVPCGTAIDLAVKIVNQSFVTAQLEAELVGENVPVGVALDFDPEPLKGVPQELRELRITLTKSGLTDVTIAFRPRNETRNLGGRDRVHLLMRCRPP